MIADVIGLSGTAVGNTVTITMLYEHFVCQAQFLLLPFFRPVYKWQVCHAQLGDRTTTEQRRRRRGGQTLERTSLEEGPFAIDLS